MVKMVPNESTFYTQLAAHALLEREPGTTREQIVAALEGNLCRCTGYTRIFMAVELAAARMRGVI